MNLEAEVSMCRAEQDALQKKNRKLSKRIDVAINQNGKLSEEGERRLMRYAVFLLKGGYHANSK